MKWDERTLCDVFRSMRDANKTRNFSYLRGLIEEGQCMAERMEAGLDAKARKIKTLERTIEGLTKKRGE